MDRIVNSVKRRLRQYKCFYPHKSKEAFRWGIIGLGNMAEVFATALDVDNDSRVEAVASRSIAKAKAFAKRHGYGRAYGSYEEMLMDKSLSLDVIYIATPAKHHAEHIHMCLEAGNNVLCEKPITSKADELDTLISLAKEKNLFLMEGMWMKCLPTFQKANEWLKEGLIGNLELIKVDFYKRELINPNQTIFNATEGGGVLHDYGIYALSFVTFFLGGIPNVLRKEMRESSFGIDADWQIYTERDGLQAFISLSSNFKGSSKAAIVGSKGGIEWDAQFNRTNRIVRYDEKGMLQEEFVVDYKSDGFEYEIEEVKNCIRAHKQESYLVSLNSSMDAITLMEMLSNKD